jgi:hypothetical protein
MGVIMAYKEITADEFEGDDRYGGDGSLYLDKDAVNHLTHEFSLVLEDHYKSYVGPRREKKIIAEVRALLRKHFRH